MTDYAKWDKLVMDISDDEGEEGEGQGEGDAEGKMEVKTELDPGEGTGLSWDGRPSAVARPSNAKGNALGTNAARADFESITDFQWDDGEASVHVTVPLAPLGDVIADTVRVTYTPTSCEISIRNDKGSRYRLLLEALPGIDPRGSSFRVDASGDGKLGGRVRVMLTKAAGGAWPPPQTFVHADRPRKRVGVTSYSWADSASEVKVYLKIPGVHTLAPENIAVRFRELSFDVLCRDVKGADYTFAVTELPMEIEVTKCTWSMDKDLLVIRMRKWAKTTWFKLQAHR